MMITIQEKIIDISPRELRAQVSSSEAELLRSYGNNSLAFFGLAPENRHFLAPNGAGLVYYRLVNNVAVVLGDPVCAPETVEQVTQSFLDFCARQHWRVAFYQASPEHLATYRALKLHAFKMGEEALLSSSDLYATVAQLWRMSAPVPGVLNATAITISWYEGVPPTDSDAAT